MRWNETAAHNAFLPCPITTYITCVRTNIPAESKDGWREGGHPQHACPPHPYKLIFVGDFSQLAGLTQMILLSFWRVVMLNRLCMFSTHIHDKKASVCFCMCSPCAYREDAKLNTSTCLPHLRRRDRRESQHGMKSVLEVVTCTYVRRCGHVINCQHGGPKAGEECQGLLRKLDVANCASQGRVIAGQIGWKAGAR